MNLRHIARLLAKTCLTSIAKSNLQKDKTPTITDEGFFW
jgi:hypothetical protein